MQNKTASLTGLVQEFRPGQRVISVYPHPSPKEGVVTGVNPVEGKIYVSWDGRIRQHDPEEVQHSRYTSFYNMHSGLDSKIAGRELEKDSFARTALAVQGWIGSGANSKELKDWLTDYNCYSQDNEKFVRYARREVKTIVASDPRMINEGDVVVLLTANGRKPGTVGICTALSEDGMAVVQLDTAWSNHPESAKIAQVPLCMLVPVENSVDTYWSSHE